MSNKLTAIFDIGKTNKKFFLFDSNYQEVYREYTSLTPTTDEDGFPTEDLEATKNWIKKVFERILNSEKYNIVSINFSTYGASLVHLDENGNTLTPLYNYTKPLEQKVLDSFYKKHGPKLDILANTGSDGSGMQNSGLQLYWLKYHKPEIFKKIKYTLHLPQYLSYIFTGIPVSEYTSIGCHTLLWDYDKKDYHQWVYAEELDKLFPPIVSTETSINMNYNGKRINIGVGIHDSSAALLPYVRSSKQSFILLSTGTWSIAFNPFVGGRLNHEDVENNCVNYMRINGKAVKASRIFLGHEYTVQVQKLAAYFGVENNHHKGVKFDYDIYTKIINDFEYMFRWESFTDEDMPQSTKIRYHHFDDAYHQLMVELVLLQLKKIKLVMGESSVENLYIDGGFGDNDIYLKLLSHHLRNLRVMTTDSSLGSAIGAAISISDKKLNSKFLKKNYSLKKHVPFVIK